MIEKFILSFYIGVKGQIFLVKAIDFIVEKSNTPYFRFYGCQKFFITLALDIGK